MNFTITLSTSDATFSTASMAKLTIENSASRDKRKITLIFLYIFVILCLCAYRLIEMLPEKSENVFCTVWLSCLFLIRSLFNQYFIWRLLLLNLNLFDN